MTAKRGGPDSDLRPLEGEAFWKRLTDVMQGELLTYRYLGRRTQDMYDVPFDSMLIRRDMRNPAGGINAAPLAIAFADSGGFTDFNAVPAPIMHALTIIDPGLDVKQIRIERELIQRGRNMGFTRTRIVDAANTNRLLALTRGMGIKLSDAPDQGGRLFDLPEQIPDRPDLPPLHEVFGGARESAGVWVLPPLKAENTGTSGSLHIGPMHIIFEAAAADLAAQAAGTDRLQPTQWEVMFVARGAVGPFATLGEAVKGIGGSVTVRLLLKDRGKDNRTIATLAASFAMI